MPEDYGKLLSIGSALTNLPAKVQEGQRQGEADYNTQELNRLNRQIAYNRKVMSDFQLMQAGQEYETSVKFQDSKQKFLEEQLQQQTAETRSLKNKIIKEDTYKAFRTYFDSSGDTRPLNNFLQEYQDTPLVKSAFKGVVRTSSINYNSPEDRDLLRQNGLTQDMLDEADGTKDGVVDWAKISSRFVKTIDSSGQASIVDMLALAAATGYPRWANDQERARMLELAKVQKTTGIADTSMMKNAKAVAEAEDRIARGEGTTADRQLVKFAAKELGGVEAGQAGIVSDARQEWETKGFDNLSQAELQKSSEARDLVNKIELAHEISPTMQKELLDLNAMVALSSEAGQLSDEQTGIWDKFTSNIGSYVDNAVSDKKAKAAYGAFINQFRHNLFGSALTEGELTAFKEAYGSLGQQAGPVLAGLRAALIQVKSKLETIANLNDPIVMKFRTGQSLEDARTALQTIDTRIALYDAIAAGEDPETAISRIQPQASASTIVPASTATPAKVTTEEEVARFLQL